MTFLIHMHRLKRWEVPLLNEKSFNAYKRSTGIGFSKADIVTMVSCRRKI